MYGGGRDVETRESNYTNAPNAGPRLRGKETNLSVACFLNEQLILWWSTASCASYHGCCTLYTSGYPNSLHGSLVLAFLLPVACLALSTTLRNEHCLDNGCLSLRILRLVWTCSKGMWRRSYCSPETYVCAQCKRCN